ncbi:MAG: DinB family protein [Bacteroidota bacterium]|nr:DinB family protein [Bacteroidota bacterium]MDE2834374.1 DinB family protein [Bacteroidota bacterium]MDE2955949.1 DinB family protein [Bacteroidota bacterium]
MKNLIPALSMLMLAVPAAAQDHDNSAYLGALVSDFDGSSSKINQLAEAIPAELYDWRPSEGVRSVSEALMHVVLANYYFSTALGHSAPEEMPEESLADKDAIKAHLMASQDLVREAINMHTSSDLAETMPMFGQEMSRYGVLMIVTGHSHEHLGQMIAYARSNNIAPPWSGG